MSCHDIGRGLNMVTKKIIELYDSGCFSTETARDLIATARNGVHWCDGNEYEAVACIRRCRCGRCLKKMKPGEQLFSIWYVSNDVPKSAYIDNCKYIEDEKPLASDGLCEECFDIILGKHCNNPTAGERERKYIMEHCDEDEYLVQEEG